MAYYSLPLWNPVLRKVVLSMPWRHNGGAGVQLHSFLPLTIKCKTVVNSTPRPLYPQGRIPVSFVPQPVWTFQRREKSHVSTGAQNPYLASCSIVTIAHSVTQTSNQHTLQSPVCIMYCTKPAVMPTVLGGTQRFFLLNLFTPVLHNIIS